MKVLYHGSAIQNLTKIKPKEAGHNKSYVYAVSELAFAAIFSVEKRNSLVAKWGRDDKGLPFFCEKTKGSFDLFYKNKKSSIYVLDSARFFQEENMWSEEYISKQEELVIKEIKIEDVKEYLLNLEKGKRFKFIRYEERRKYFPNIDKEGMRDVKKMVEKYGKEKTMKVLKKWRPDLLKELNL